MRIIRRKEVEERIGLRRSTIYDKLNPKSPRYDPNFPKPFNISNGRAVGWLEAAIDKWIEAQAGLSA